MCWWIIIYSWTNLWTSCPTYWSLGSPSSRGLASGLFSASSPVLSSSIYFSLHDYIDNYLQRLEDVVAASKAPILKVTVEAETRRQVVKVFKNSFVEKFVVTGPCTFHVFPVMEKLKEVVVKLNTTLPCTYWKSKANDRELHRAGLCCVSVGAVYKNCPNLERFMGVEMGLVTQKQSFAKWNIKMKKIFYKHYLDQGGNKNKKDWEKTRWLSRQPVLSRLSIRIMQWFFGPGLL